MSPRNPTLARMGERLRALREERGMTQEAVAVRAGFTSKYVSEVERGTRDVPLSTLRALVEDGLGRTLEEAFGGPGAGGLVARDASLSYAPRPLPATVERLAREIAGLDPEPRRSVLAIARTALNLAKRGR